MRLSASKREIKTIQRTKRNAQARNKTRKGHTNKTCAIDVQNKDGKYDKQIEIECINPR